MKLNTTENAFINEINEKNLDQCSFAGEFYGNILHDLDVYDVLKLPDENYKATKNEIVKINALNYMSEKDNDAMRYGLYRKGQTKIGIITVNYEGNNLDSAAKVIYSAYRLIKENLFKRIDGYYIYALEGKELNVALARLNDEIYIEQ